MESAHFGALPLKEEIFFLFKIHAKKKNMKKTKQNKNKTKKQKIFLIDNTSCIINHISRLK